MPRRCTSRPKALRNLSASSPPESTARLTLLVVGSAKMDSFRLPTEGVVRIGRSETCDVRLDDPSVGDVHAVLRVQRPLMLIDLRSGSQTKIGGQIVPPGGHLPLSPGVVFTLGAVTFVIQQTKQSGRLRHIRSHDYFEARIEDECLRAADTGASFAVVRFLIGEGASHRIEESFAVLPPKDVVATYTPNEYEVLILDVTPERAREISGDVASRMRANGVTVEFATACYPSDARTPEALLLMLNVLLHGGAPVKPDSVVPAATMDRLRPVLERVAAGNIAVLILGETGVGKEVMANAIHAMSPRAKRPLVTLNCAAMSETLLESELFGYERGAFTGAVTSKPGLLETTEGGTLFLDEIGEMSLTVQAKLLRVLEHKQVTRLGALSPRPIDARFVAATNRDLEEEVEKGQFRRDLYFRIAGFTIAIPPLRERVAEIASLANMFVREACEVGGRDKVPSISADALGMLERYTWPGNVRELRNVMDRAVLLCTDNLIEPAHLPLDKMGRTMPMLRPLPPPRVEPFAASTRASYPPPLAGTWPPPPLDPIERDQERARIVHALEACAGNQTKAAQMLGMARRTLISRIERYGLPRPKK
jgi:two-component system, NtrC family, response regulator AtoC